jgi:hypothetical protein
MVCCMVWSICAYIASTYSRVSGGVFMPKPSTHRMHDIGSVVPHIRPKVFTGTQKSRIKYIYYIDNVSRDYDDSKWNGIAENSITPQEWQPGQHIAYNSSSKNSSPSSPSEEQVWVAGENSKVEYTYGWYSASAGMRLYLTLKLLAPKLQC